MGFFGFNNKRKSTIGGDFDGDGVKNRKDCQPMNWKKQDKTEKDWEKARREQLISTYDDCYECGREGRLVQGICKKCWLKGG